MWIVAPIALPTPGKHIPKLNNKIIQKIHNQYATLNRMGLSVQFAVLKKMIYHKKVV